MKAIEKFADRLLDWYRAHYRELPWRQPPCSPDERGTVTATKAEQPNPYYVWLSEIMLQQTTVATVIPYFTTFISKWPTIEDFANADIEDLRRNWAGLGYYRRLENAYKCAKLIQSQCKGVIPCEEAKLLTLPGIGPYTAAAISAIAFEKQSVVIDGNIERLFSRLHALAGRATSPKSDQYLVAQKYVPVQDIGDYTQAMMDFASIICKPKQPQCEICIFKSDCCAYAKDEVLQFPVKKRKKERPIRFTQALIVENQNKEIWLEKRPERGLLASMMGLPTSEWEQTDQVIMTAPHSYGPGDRKTNQKNLDHRSLKALSSQFKVPFFLNLSDAKKLGIVTHDFTHFRLIAQLWYIQLSESLSSIPTKSKGRFCPINEIQNEALPTLFQKLITSWQLDVRPS